MRLLLVDKDADVERRMKALLPGVGYHLCAEKDGADGERRALGESFDALILGTDPPEHEGIERCRSLRANGVRAPIVMLASECDATLGARCLNVGADALFSRSFNELEFLARLRVLLPGALQLGASRLRYQDLEMDLTRRTVARGDERITLTRQEFMLLEQLLRCPEQTLTPFELAERVWNTNYAGVQKLVKAYMWRLRQKVDKAPHDKLIHTIRGFGYTLNRFTHA